MPKKQAAMTQKEQSKLFRDAVRDMIDAGELSPTEADEAFESLMRRIKSPSKDAL